MMMIHKAQRQQQCWKTLGGFINLWKPSGMTSHDCIDKVRQLLATRKVGHGGTLDPMATGVLPIAVGPCTKLLRYLSVDKVYHADIQFGVSTDSDDAEGVELSRAAVPWLTYEDVERALKSFEGEIDQIPPMISAIKVRGQRLYKLARSNRIDESELQYRRVRIDRVQLVDWKVGEFPLGTILVHCGPGTYIRSIARDCGRLLRRHEEGGTSGCALGHIARLERRQSGAFTKDSSITLEKMSELIQTHEFTFIAPDHPLFHLPAVILCDDNELRYWECGRSFPIQKERICFSETMDSQSSVIASGDAVRVYYDSHQDEQQQQQQPSFLGVALVCNFKHSVEDTEAVPVLKPSFMMNR